MDSADKPLYPWNYDKNTQSIKERFEVPKGFQRVIPKKGSFGYFLQHLPVKPGRPPVKLYDGSLKGNQAAHAAVLDIDVGKRDLQQCADAAMRVWAEYLRSIRRDDLICFKTAAGGRAKWSKWRDGYRPSKANPKVWQKQAQPSSSYSTFKSYLTKVFGVANSASILRQMVEVDDQRDVRHGDIFIQGATKRGYGHAVIVVDVAENSSGQRVFLLAQSYMPAQEIHVLKNPTNAKSPWYSPTDNGALITPEWRFGPRSLHRFIKDGC
jgi:hypothetical protein